MSQNRTADDRCSGLKLFLLIAAVLCVPVLQSRSDHCTTPSLDGVDDLIDLILESGTYEPDLQRVEFSLAFKLVPAPDNSLWSADIIPGLLAEATEVFGAHGISFTLVSVNTLPAFTDVCAYEFCDPGAINVFVLTQNDYAYGPGHACEIGSGVVVLGANDPHQFTHELGHAIGLWHTYQSGNTSSPRCAEEGSVGTWPAGEDSGIVCGDKVPDTPWMPSGTEGFMPVPPASTCNWFPDDHAFWDFVDPFLKQVFHPESPAQAPSPRNVMNESSQLSGPCLDELTSQQGKRILRVVEEWRNGNPGALSDPRRFWPKIYPQEYAILDQVPIPLFVGETAPLAWTTDMVMIADSLIIDQVDIEVVRESDQTVLFSTQTASLPASYGGWTPALAHSGGGVRFRLSFHNMRSSYLASDYPGTVVLIEDVLDRVETVSEPEAGEEWFLGESLTIEWTTGNSWRGQQLVLDEVDVLLAVNGQQPYVELATSEPNDGSFVWTPQVAHMGQQNQIVLRFHNVVNGQTRDSDPSEAFAISDILARVETITAPTGGANLLLEAPFTIEWTTANSYRGEELVLDRVDILLSLDGVEPYLVLASDEVNDGEFAWTPSLSQVGASNRVKLRLHNIINTQTRESDPTEPFEVTPISFVARSGEETGFDWPGEPFASVAADLDGDGDKDLLISDQRVGQFAGWMEHQDNQDNPELPRFQDLATLGATFAPTELPTSLRGLTVADIDNDDDLDFFAASAAAPRLYRKASGTYAYAAVPDASFPQALSTLAGNSWSASFGDFDRDGLVDLYIGRATASTPSNPADATPDQPLADVLLRNLGNATFSNVTSLGIDTSDPLATASATWADFDRDGNLDLLVGSFGSEDSKLYRNTLDATGNRSFVLRADLLPASTALHAVRSVHAADLDNDGDLDVALGHGQAGQTGALLLWNDGSGDLATATNVPTSAPVAASAVLDHDLDGALDLLLTADVPSSTPSTPTLLHNQLQSPGSFSDVTASTGLSQPVAKRTTAIALADFGGIGGSDDGDLDLYLGRPSASDQFFYQATSAAGSDDPAGAWLKLRVQAPAPSGSKLAGNNKRLIGAEVTVQQPSTGTAFWQQTQLVDGGSGYGSQSDLLLSFGIPDPNQSAKITLRAPDGSITTQTVAANSYDTQLTLEDVHSPTVDSNSASFSYFATQGPTIWTFQWFCSFAAGYHEVYVVEGQGCNLGPGSSITLQPGMAGVAVNTLPVAGGYLVTLTWSGVNCQAPCVHQYRVRSYNAATMSQSALKPAQVSTCGQIGEQ